MREPTILKIMTLHPSVDVLNAAKGVAEANNIAK